MRMPQLIIMVMFTIMAMQMVDRYQIILPKKLIILDMEQTDMYSDFKPKESQAFKITFLTLPKHLFLNKSSIKSLNLFIHKLDLLFWYVPHLFLEMTDS